MSDDGTADGIAELRAQGLSVRAISERTGIPRSTVADRLARLPHAAPGQVTGRDGRRYPAVRCTDDDEDHDPTPAVPRSTDPRERELARILLLQDLRSARRLVADAMPLSDEDRARIGRDLRAIARRAGVRDSMSRTRRRAPR